MKSVTTSVLISRINRHLASDYQMLRKTHGQRAYIDLGRYYVHDYRRNISLNTFIDLESFGREIGVLKEFEAIND